MCIAHVTLGGIQWGGVRGPGTSSPLPIYMCILYIAHIATSHMCIAHMASGDLQWGGWWVRGPGTSIPPPIYMCILYIAHMVTSHMCISHMASGDLQWGGGGPEVLGQFFYLNPKMAALP